MKLIIKSILESDIRIKRSILLLFDLLVIILSIYITPILINFYDKNPNFDIKLLVIYSLFIALPFYIISGQYKGITRYFGSQSTYQLCIRNFILLVILNPRWYLKKLISNLKVPSSFISIKCSLILSE